MGLGGVAYGPVCGMLFQWGSTVERALSPTDANRTTSHRFNHPRLNKSKPVFGIKITLDVGTA